MVLRCGTVWQETCEGLLSGDARWRRRVEFGGSHDVQVETETQQCLSPSSGEGKGCAIFSFFFFSITLSHTLTHPTS